MFPKMDERKSEMIGDPKEDEKKQEKHSSKKNL